MKQPKPASPPLFRSRIRGLLNPPQRKFTITEAMTKVQPNVRGISIQVDLNSTPQLKEDGRTSTGTATTNQQTQKHTFEVTKLSYSRPVSVVLLQQNESTNTIKKLPTDLQLNYQYESRPVIHTKGV